MNSNTASTAELEFLPFPKMARLSREVIVTEKIDGTNAQVFIRELNGVNTGQMIAANDTHAIYAGSRNRWLTVKEDNFGFAKWVEENAGELFKLGPGRHFGEWWGSGIQRGYGLAKGEKRFSLFNTIRWCLHNQEPKQIQTGDPRIVKFQERLPECCLLVPELCREIGFEEGAIFNALYDLEHDGSKASPGFMDPEGIVVFHVAAGIGFKKTIKDDESPKSALR